MLSVLNIAYTAAALIVFLHTVVVNGFCAQPDVPENGHVIFPSSPPLRSGTKIKYKCDVGFVHLGIEERICQENGQWSSEAPVCAINVALYKPATQSSTAWNRSLPLRANLSTDGNLDGYCTRTLRENRPWWQVDLLEPHGVYAVELLFSDASESLRSDRTILEIRVGPFPATGRRQNALCYRHEGSLASPWHCGTLPNMDSWGVYSGSCFHGSQEALPWFSANSRCLTNGATLASEITDHKQRFLSSQLEYRAAGDAEHYWIGLVSNPREGIWRWSGGETLAPTEGVWAQEISHNDRYGRRPSASANGAALTRAFFWKWVPKPQPLWLNFICEKKLRFCTSPGVPANGGVMLSGETYRTGTYAYYYCDYGFALHGAESRLCMTNGTWSKRAPTCYSVNCGQPGSLTNGYVTLLNGSTVFGSVASYKCLLGYQLKGISFRTCQPSAQWSGGLPTCSVIDCGTPANIANGTKSITGNNSRMGAVVEYTCFPGFRLVGSAVRHCSENTMWTPEPPTCYDTNSLQASFSDKSTPIDQLHPWTYQTNLLTGFIIAVVVLLVAVFLILFCIWKKKQLYDTFSTSSIYATNKPSNYSTNVNVKDVLYAYTAANGNTPAKEESFYGAPRCSPSHVSTSFSEHYTAAPPLSVVSASEMYYSITANKKPVAPAAGANANEQNDLVLMTELELPPQMLKLQTLPNGNVHLTLPCIRRPPARPPLPFKPSSVKDFSEPKLPPTPPKKSANSVKLPVGIDNLTRRRSNIRLQERRKKFHTMVGFVRKKISSTTPSSRVTPDAWNVSDDPLQAYLKPPNRPIPLPKPTKLPLSSSDTDLTRRNEQNNSPTPTEILFSFDDADIDEEFDSPQDAIDCSAQHKAKSQRIYDYPPELNGSLVRASANSNIYEEVSQTDTAARRCFEIAHTYC